MTEPDPGTILSYQVLADPSGRRRRRLAIAGRVATAALGLWLAVLILGGLGLQPLSGIPVAGDLGAQGTEPPPLPERVHEATTRHPGVVPAPPRATREPGTTNAPARPRHLERLRHRDAPTPTPPKTRVHARK